MRIRSNAGRAYVFILGMATESLLKGRLSTTGYAWVCLAFVAVSPFIVWREWKSGRELFVIDDDPANLKEEGEW